MCFFLSTHDEKAIPSLLLLSKVCCDEKYGVYSGNVKSVMLATLVIDIILTTK